MYVRMCVCVQLLRPDRLLHFSIENVSKRLDYLVVVDCVAILAFCRCCHPTGRWLAALWAEKHNLIEGASLIAGVDWTVMDRTGMES